MKKNQHSTTKRFILVNQALHLSLAIGEHFSLNQSEEDLLHQLISVFRTKAGDLIILMNKNTESHSNTEFLFKVLTIHKKELTLELVSKQEISNELSVNLSLAIGLPNKPAKLEFILEKAVELGARHIFLIKTEYSQFAHNLRLDRLEKIVHEATEQSERAVLPQIQMYESLNQFLEEHGKNTFVALERSEETNDLLTVDLPEQLNLLIGPEGGFSQNEVDMMGAHQMKSFKLGGSILRMETAVMLALGVVRLRTSN